MTASANQAGIPRILHQIWYQGEAQMPDKFRRFSQGWRANHPDWSFHLWNETTMRDFMAENYGWFLPVYDGYPFNIQRIDAVRYFILDTMGGALCRCRHREPEAGRCAAGRMLADAVPDAGL